MDIKKYDKPEFVIIWETHPGMPRCCFLCQFFKNPICEKYGMQVPEDFARKLDQCQDWLDEDGVPF